jgi:hypothetical protein
MEQSKRQTAVEWIMSQLEEQIRKSAHNELGTIRGSDYRIGLTKAIEFCEQAKQTEKEQIELAWERGLYISQTFPQLITEPGYEDSSEEYYNQVYGTE